MTHTVAARNLRRSILLASAAAVLWSNPALA